MKGKILEGAKWIWLDPVTYPQFQTSAYTLFCEKMPYCVAHFRKKIWLNDVPMSVKTAVSADCKYILRVNGETVSRGPAIVGGDYGNTQPLGYRFYDFPSVRFCRGENEIDAFVLLAPTVESDYSDGHGGFLFASELTFPGGENLRILSDESWLAWRDERFTADYQTDLTLTSCAEIPAKVTKDIWRLEEKKICELGSEKIFPLQGEEYSAIGGKEIRIDLGKVYTGYLHIEGDVEEAASIEISFFEREGWPITFRDSGKEFLRVNAGRFRFEHLHLRSARYIFLKSTAAIRLSAWWEYVTYPVRRRGSFCCSDPDLNKIYEVSVRTARNCLNTYHMDSPVHQEAPGCTGDYFIQSLIGYYAFGESALTRLDLVRDARYFILKNGHRLHTSYGMIWPQWLSDYIRYTGDDSVLGETKDALAVLMRRYEGYLNEEGIVSSPPNFWFVDWSLPEGYGPLDRAKIIWQAAVTAFTYRGFQSAAEIMQKCSEDALSAHYREVAEKIKRGFSVFWDEERGLYFGGLEENGVVGRKYFGIHENVLAVLYGLYEGDEKVFLRKVMEESALTPAQPYFMHFVLEALLKAGLFEEYGIALLKRWMSLLDECDSSLKEAWHSMPGCDYSHAWSGTPGYILPRAVLGVYPAEKGWKDISFFPQLCGAGWNGQKALSLRRTAIILSASTKTADVL